jgi:chemotaxis protein CheX
MDVQTMIGNLVQSTQDVFERMVFRSVTAQTPIHGQTTRPRSNVVALVGFAGETSGLVAFYSTLEAAREIAGAMLGVSPADVDGDMPDAIGEVSNMIAGAFRSRLAEAGTQCAISVPTVTTGSDFHTRCVSQVQRVLCPFTMDSHEVFVELVVTKQ